MINNIKIYYESKKTDLGFQIYKIVLMIENKNITGYKINQNNNDLTLLIGKNINENLLEIIEFDQKLYTKNVLYGHFIKDGSFYGEWRECNNQDCKNLIADKPIILKSICSETIDEVNSLIQSTILIEKEEMFLTTKENLENKLCLEDAFTYQYIKKGN